MTRAIEVILKDNGSPIADATVTLADATGTFGIRIVGGAIVVASGTPVPYVANGLYRYNFTGATAGVAYEATARVAYADGSVDYADRPLAAIGGTGDPAGDYATLADLYNWQGEANVILYSDTQGQDAANFSRIQAALDRADAEINATLTMRGYLTPLVGPAWALELLRQAACGFALYYLYSPRDNRDSDGEPTDFIRANTWRKRAGDDLRDIATIPMTGAARLTDSAASPIGVG